VGEMFFGRVPPPTGGQAPSAFSVTVSGL
jgi:hypothetical protein